METIHFHITRKHEQYVAEGLEEAIVTQAPTMDELLLMIQEAVALHFEEEQQLPTILVDMNLTELAHA